MANRVPLVVDQSTLYIKELPLADNLDLTGCGIIGISSFLPGTGGGQRFIGIVTFGDGNGTNIGAGLTGVYVNDGLQANYLKATNLTNQRIITAGVGGTLTDSGNLTFDGINFDITGSGEVSANWKVGGATTFTGAIDANGALDVDGQTDLDVLNVAETTTLSALLDANKSVQIAENLQVTGLTTFTGNSKFEGNLDVIGNLNYTTVTDIQSTGIVTAQNGVRVTANGLTVSGVQTSTGHILPAADSTHDLGDSSTYWRHIYCDDITTGGGGGGTIGLDIVTRHLNVTGFSTFAELIDANGSVQIAKDLQVTGLSTFTGNIDANGQLDVANTAQFNNDTTFVGAASTNLVWLKDTAVLKFNDKAFASFGNGQDLRIHHNGSNSIIQDQGTGSIEIESTNGTGVYLQGNSAYLARFRNGSTVDLYYDNVLKFATSGVGATVYGTGALNIPVGTTAQRPSTGGSPQNGDIRYNSTTNSYEGYGNGAWGGLGGGTEIDNIIATTSATGVGTFAHASYRSASIRAQIDQGGNYQVGRYLLIHDGTTVTVVEEAAIATGSMLGTFDGVINGSNVEFKVTMGSAGIATVTTIIDKITI